MADTVSVRVRDNNAVVVGTNSGTINVTVNIATDATPHQQLLQALSFPKVFSRLSQVKQTNISSQALGWIFDEQHKGCPVQFLQWLEIDAQSIYWITGKPGAGKSVLMNHMLCSARTLSSLREWTGTQELIIAAHFFWVAGSDLQKDLPGFLRSLLLQIINLIPEASQTLQANIGGPPVDGIDIEWSWPQQTLQAALLELLSARSHCTKFCFFIDGIDECEQDLSDLLRLLAQLRNLRNVRLCVSSRDWSQIRDSIQSMPYQEIRVHEHTRKDIRAYALRSLCEDTYLRKVLQEINGHPNGICEYAALGRSDNTRESYASFETDGHDSSNEHAIAYKHPVATAISEKAEGVFLWVSMVVEEIKRVSYTITCIDTILDMVDDFPNELKEFFERLLERIPHQLRKSSAQLLLNFQMSDYWGRRFPPIFMLSDVKERILFDSERAQQKTSMTVSRWENLLLQAERYIRDRSADIIRIKKLTSSFHETNVCHRAGHDFLQHPDVQGKLREWSGRGFDSLVALCEGTEACWRLVIELNVTRSEVDRGGKAWDFYKLSFELCRLSQLLQERASTHAVSLLDKAAAHEPEFLSAALRYPLPEYVISRSHLFATSKYKCVRDRFFESLFSSENLRLDPENAFRVAVYFLEHVFDLEAETTMAKVQPIRSLCESGIWRAHVVNKKRGEFVVFRGDHPKFLKVALLLISYGSKIDAGRGTAPKGFKTSKDDDQSLYDFLQDSMSPANFKILVDAEESYEKSKQERQILSKHLCNPIFG